MPSTPLVGVIMGSASDYEHLAPACEMLDQFGVPYEKAVVSAHRTPDWMFEYAAGAHAQMLHLIALAHGYGRARGDDTLERVLNAPDRDELLDWLRGLPLAHREQGVLFVHAGVLPDWDADRTLALSEEVRLRLAADRNILSMQEVYRAAGVIAHFPAIKGIPEFALYQNSLQAVLPVWLRIWGATQNGAFNLKVVR